MLENPKINWKYRVLQKRKTEVHLCDQLSAFSKSNVQCLKSISKAQFLTWYCRRAALSINFCVFICKTVKTGDFPVPEEGPEEVEGNVKNWFKLLSILNASRFIKRERTACVYRVVNKGHRTGYWTVCQEQMCQGIFCTLLLQVKNKGSLSVCKNWIVKRLKFSYTIFVHVLRIL